MVRRTSDASTAAWWTFMAAHALLVQRVGGELSAATALPLASFNVLRLLYEAPSGRLRLSELAEAVHLTRSGLTRLANRLEKGALLRREGGARDRRVSWAALTDQGRDEFRRARIVFARAVATHFGNCLSDEEAEDLSRVLTRMLNPKTGAD